MQGCYRLLAFYPVPMRLCGSYITVDGSFKVLVDFLGRHGATLWLASESHNHIPKEMPEHFSSSSHIEVASASSQELLLLCSLKDSIPGSLLSDRLDQRN